MNWFFKNYETRYTETTKAMARQIKSDWFSELVDKYAQAESIWAPMDVMYKKLFDDAITPKYAKQGDAGLDLFCHHISETDPLSSQVTYHTGIAVEIPKGYVGLLFPRSSIYRTNLRQSNCVGVIDSGYRGEIKIVYDIQGSDSKIYQQGDRIGQLVIIPYPEVNLIETDELSKTERGEGGYGSTGL